LPRIWDQQEEITKTFRSAATNFTFGDLRNQVALFTQIRLNETLGLIREHGLSKNRQTAMVKMDYYLQTLEDQENKSWRRKGRGRAPHQKPGTHAKLRARHEIPSGTSPTGDPILDQGLIDSLLANDAYNFLIHQALERPQGQAYPGGKNPFSWRAAKAWRLSSKMPT